MKLKMLEHFQGTDLPTLMEGKEYDVDQALADYLLAHKKAVAVKEPVHYGAQKEPELRHDDEEAAEM